MLSSINLNINRIPGGILHSEKDKQQSNNSLDQNQKRKNLNQSSIKSLNDITSKTQPKRQKIFTYIQADDPSRIYFMDIYSIFHNSEKISLNEKMHNKKQVKEWFWFGIKQMLMKQNDQQNEQFKKKFDIKSVLGLKGQQLGFGNANLIESQKWNKILRSACLKFSSLANTTLYSAEKSLKRYLIQSKFCKKIYQLEVNFYKPNIKIIDEFYLDTNKNDIDYRNTSFNILLEQMCQVYFNQFQACLLVYSKICRSQQLQIQYNKFLIEQDKNKFFLTLWQTYKTLAIHYQKYDYLSQKDEKQLKLKRIIYVKMNKMLGSIIRLIYEVGTTFFDEQKIYRCFRSDIKRYHEVIQFIDQDIQRYDQSKNSHVISPQKYAKLLIQLTLSIFPFHFLYEENIKQSFKIQQLYKIMEYLKNQGSTFFRGFAIIFPLPNKEQQSTYIKRVEGELLKLIKKNQWNMSSHHWKKWIGLYLKYYSECQNCIGDTDLLAYIIRLIKIIFSESPLVDEFWKNHQQKEVKKYTKQFLASIQKFIKKQSQNNFCLILPILTKILTSNRNNHYEQFTKLIHVELIKCSIFNVVIENLKLNSEEKQKQRRQRNIILYHSEASQGSIQQQIKFLCKLVCANIQELDKIEDDMMLERGENGCGIYITIFLVKVFFAIQPNSDCSLKCLRYLVEALDCIFCFRKTRMYLPIALGLIQNDKSKKNIIDLVSVCSQLEENTQMSRQAKKLRVAISKHLNNIVRISDCLNDYFPTINHSFSKKFFDGLSMNIKQKRYQQIKLTFEEQIPLTKLKAVSWFYHLLLILQSESLNAIDYETIRLLAFKMRIKANGLAEYQNMMLVKQLLNKSQIVNLIQANLKPKIVDIYAQETKKKMLFGLTNFQHSTFLIKQNLPIHYDTKQKYRSKSYILSKKDGQIEKQTNQLYGSICGALNIIQSILRLALEDKSYPILNQLLLYQFVIKNIATEKSLFFYNIKFATKVVKQVEQTQAKKIFKLSQNFINQHELQTELNIIHVISSFLDFEHRLKVKNVDYPNLQINFVPYLEIDIQQYTESQEMNSRSNMKQNYENESSNPILHISPHIITLTNQNIFTLSNNCRGNDQMNIGVVAVLRILGSLIQLNHGKSVYNSLIHRNYPKNLSCDSFKVQKQNLKEFFDAIVQILIRKTTKIFEKEAIFEFLAICLKQKYFSEYIYNNLPQFKEAIYLNWRDMKSNSIMLTNKIMLFCHQLAYTKYQNSNNLSCVTKLISKLFCSSKLSLQFLIEQFKQNQIKIKNYQGNNLYFNYFNFQINLQKVTITHSLFLFISIFSFVVASERNIVVGQLFRMLLSNSHIILAQNNFEAPINITYRFNLTPRYELKFIINENTSCCLLQKTMLENTLSVNPFAFGQFYIYNPFDLFYQLCQNQNKEDIHNRVVNSFQLNIYFSLYHCCLILKQFYNSFLTFYLQTGKYGYCLTDYQCDELVSDKNILDIIKFNRCKLNNKLSGRQAIFSNSQNDKITLFNYIKKTIKQIWQQQELQYLTYPSEVLQVRKRGKKNSKNSGILLLVELIKCLGSYNHFSSTDQFQITAQNLLGYIGISDNQILLKPRGLLMSQILNIENIYFNKKLNQRKKLIQEDLSQHYMIINKILNIVIQFQVNEKKNAYSLKMQLNDKLLLIQLVIKVAEHERQILNNQKMINYKDLMQCDERKLFLELLKKIIIFLIKLFKQLQIIERDECLLIIHCLCLFEKCILIDEINLSTFALKEEIIYYMTHDVVSVIDRNFIDISDRDREVLCYFYTYFSTISLVSGEQFDRDICKIIHKNFNRIMSKIDGRSQKINNIYKIVEATSLFKMFLILFKDENWKQLSMNDVLQKIFLFIQKNNSIQFDSSKFIPQNDIEIELSKQFIFEDSSQEVANISQKTKSKQNQKRRYNPKKSLFEVVCLLQSNQMIKYYILTWIQMIKNSKNLYDLHNKIVKSELDEQTWQKIKCQLIQIIKFYQNINELISNQPNLLRQGLILNTYICLEGSYTYEFNAINSLFQNYDDSEDFICDVYENIIYLEKCVILYIQTWRKFDWISRVNWSKNRTELMIKYAQMAKKYLNLAKKQNKKSIFDLLKTILERVNRKIQIENDSIIL